MPLAMAITPTMPPVTTEVHGMAITKTTARVLTEAHGMATIKTGPVNLLRDRLVAVSEMTGMPDHVLPETEHQVKRVQARDRTGMLVHALLAMVTTQPPANSRVGITEPQQARHNKVSQVILVVLATGLRAVAVPTGVVAAPTGVVAAPTGVVTTTEIQVQIQVLVECVAKRHRMPM